MNASSLSRRHLSIWLKRLATDRITRLAPKPDDRPLVTVAPVKSALRLVAADAAATRLGLHAGMALADARAMFPSLIVMDADPAADAHMLTAIAEWCDRYTPLVGLDPPDGLVLDVTGCAHLFGGEAALCRDLVTRLTARGFHVRLAIADTIGCAWAVARYGNTAIVPPGRVREAIYSLPLAAMRITAKTVDSLAQLGLRRVGDVLDNARAPFAARFGQVLLQRIDMALGQADEPMTPRLPLPALVAERRFAAPIALAADVIGTIARLARELELVLERRGEGARLLQVALFRTDGKVFRIEAGTVEPLRDAARAKRLFVEKLAAVSDDHDPGFGYDVIRLCAMATERLNAVQTSLEVTDGGTDIAHLVDVLGARFGLRRVTRPVARDSHIPEFATAAMPAHMARANSGPRQHFEARTAQDYPLVAPDILSPARPIRLFAQPERIEAIAEVPDGPPVRFRWRRVLHEVAAAEGPERIAMEWWRDEEDRVLTRDYFRVESSAGMRVWLYREGLYERETPTPRWFIHGLFA
ncbi:MAG: DNA polymerase Y family protein [Proteobacteria bacterium]|nr:DNA polymerase Y family protein [Pseudomonadota bacterium]